MKIAVIGREGRVFPQCEEIAQVEIVDIDPRSHSVQQTALLTPPLDKEAMANWLGQQAVEVVLTSGICRYDRELLERNGIQVVAGVPQFRFEPVIAQFVAGILQTGDNACEHREGHRE